MPTTPPPATGSEAADGANPEAPSEAGATAPADEATTAEGDAAATEAPAETTEPPAESPQPAAPPAETAPPVSEPSAEAAALATTQAPPPKPPSSAGIFAQGRVRVGGTIGVSTAVGGGSSNSWFILGLGAGVFVLDGLEPHADATFWIGDPFLTTVTPGVRYVFHMVPVVKPYVGTFYRHYFVSGELSDSDSIGGRAGINFMLSESSYVAGGVIYEHFLDSAIFSNPDQVYPEIMVAVAF